MSGSSPSNARRVEKNTILGNILMNYLKWRELYEEETGAVKGSETR